MLNAKKKRNLLKKDSLWFYFWVGCICTIISGISAYIMKPNYVWAYMGMVSGYLMMLYIFGSLPYAIDVTEPFKKTRMIINIIIVTVVFLIFFYFGPQKVEFLKKIVTDIHFQHTFALFDLIGIALLIYGLIWLYEKVFAGFITRKKHKSNIH